MAKDPNPDWRPARVVENREVARGSIWLTLEAVDDRPASYAPGNVLGLGLPQPDGSYLRHAYTVSRADPKRRRFEHLYRIIPEGRMTPKLARLVAGDPVHFHGPHHTPIQEEVAGEAEGIVGLATGVGIGPLFGFAEKTLEEGERRPLKLYVGMREELDLCLTKEAQALSARFPNFSLAFSLTRPDKTWTGLRGRLTESVPPLLREMGLPSLHVHLVGNGEMVHVMRQALYEAGVLKERVSMETYFNHRAKPAREGVLALARTLSG